MSGYAETGFANVTVVTLATDENGRVFWAGSAVNYRSVLDGLAVRGGEGRGKISDSVLAVSICAKQICAGAAVLGSQALKYAAYLPGGRAGFGAANARPWLKN